MVWGGGGPLSTNKLLSFFEEKKIKCKHMPACRLIIQVGSPYSSYSSKGIFGYDQPNMHCLSACRGKRGGGAKMIERKAESADSS